MSNFVSILWLTLKNNLLSKKIADDRVGLQKKNLYLIKATKQIQSITGCREIYLRGVTQILRKNDLIYENHSDSQNFQPICVTLSHGISF